MGSASRQAVLIGNTGFLGKALESQLVSARDSGVSLIRADQRALIAAALDSSKRAHVIDSLLTLEVPQDWIFAAGIVDPHRDRSELEMINVEAPVRLLNYLCDAPRRQALRLITFGSVLENSRRIAAANPYLHSKARLFNLWREQNANRAVTWIHVQLHTLYGGPQPPHSFMFTGQMLSALTSGSCFRMSAGTQLREYHHVEDIARSVLSLLDANGMQPKLIELSSGEPVRLRDLARAVFEHFNAIDRLLIGAHGSPDAEVFENMYTRSAHLVASRDPCAGVIDWFEALGVRGS